MEELWTVEFSLFMRDVAESDTPSVDGEMLVRAHGDIFDVLETAKKRLEGFGYDGVIIHGGGRCAFEKQEAKTGHWNGPECSACHAILEKKANFEWCPHCGAHMIEKVKENEK